MHHGTPAPEPRDVFLHRRPYEPGLYSDAGFGPPRRLAGELFAIRRGHWKYIEGVELNVTELFHLAADPAERHNLIATSPPIAADLHRALHVWLTANLRAAEQRGNLVTRGPRPAGGAGICGVGGAF